MSHQGVWTSGFIREYIKAYGVLCCAERNLLTSNPYAKHKYYEDFMYPWKEELLDL